MATSGTTNENNTVHSKEWMTAIKCKSRCTTSRDKWLQLELLNKQTIIKKIQCIRKKKKKSSWS